VWYLDVLDRRCRRPAITLADDRAVVEQHADQLFDEERISVGALEHLAAQLLGQTLNLEKRAHECGGFLPAEGLEHDPARLEPSGAPARPLVEELGPRKTEDEDRGIAAPGRQVLDQIEERQLGPVDVFEDD